MRRLAFVALSLIAFVPAPVSAACKNDFLAVESWSFRDNGDGKVEIAFTLKPTESRAIRMLDATFGFNDKLGGELGAVRVTRDAAIAEGGSWAETVTRPAKGFSRLLKVDKADVEPFACVRGVIYADGEVAKF